jgi:hypothetical protein
MKFRIYASFSYGSIYYIHIPCPKNMEYRAQKILNKLERLLEWCPQDKDTAFYREIQVLVRYYEIKLLEEESK